MRTNSRIDRDTLREPFYVESYLTAPFALLSSTATIMTRSQTPWLIIGGVALLV